MGQRVLELSPEAGLVVVLSGAVALRGAGETGPRACRVRDRHDVIQEPAWYFQCEGIHCVSAGLLPYSLGRFVRISGVDRRAKQALV